MKPMENLKRRPGEQEDDFRVRQKAAEIRHYLQLVPLAFEEFVVHPLWKESAFGNGNLTFNSGNFTIFTKNGKFNWIVGGGKALYGPGGFPTREGAQQDLWDTLQAYVV